MTSPVIKAFRDLTDGGKLYAPASVRNNTYTGKREDELREKGYLGQAFGVEEGNSKVIDDQVTNIVDSEEERPLEDLKNDELKKILDDFYKKEYPSKANKDELIALIREAELEATE